MSRLFSTFFIFVLYCGAAIAQYAPSGYNSKPNGPSAVEGENTSIIQLLANPMKYNNRRIRIIGFVNLEFEGNAIYLHREDFEHSIAENSIWVNLPNEMVRKQIEEVNKRYVICEGVFHAGLHGHMGMFGGELSDINRLEPWSFDRSK